jgi:hypothetical protein
MVSRQQKISIISISISNSIGISLQHHYNTCILFGQQRQLGIIVLVRFSF